MTPSTTIDPPTTGSSLRRKAYAVSLEKTLANIADLAARPTTTWSFDREGDYEKWPEGFFEIGNWTTSFFTGMAVIGLKQTGDPRYLAALEKLEPPYREKIGPRGDDTMHDLGFLYSLYAVALHKVAGIEMFRDLGLLAARRLADRFIPEGGYIRAWGRMDEADTDYAGLAIIDCMMNLPLLYWAHRETGEERFRDIAVRHADTTLKCFLREDGSVCHAYRFGPDGIPTGPDNYCGRAVESHWARGTAWAMYGFALSYRHTGDERYLAASLRVTRRFLELLGDQAVPVWDFRLAEGEPPLPDSSAAAVAVCALQVLGELGAADDAMRARKDAMLDALCSPEWFNDDPACRGLLRNAQVGDGVGRAKNVYTSWGDYYLAEALAREAGMAVDWW